MRFQPKTDAQIEEERAKALGVWPIGVYDFEVSGAVDEISSKGNEMITLTLFVYNRDGERKTIKDYLLESIAYKLRHAAASCGLTAQYDRGELQATDFNGRSGRLRLGIEKDTSGGGYPDKNKVQDYEKAAPVASRPASARKPVPAGAGSDLDDSIPFGPCWQ